MKKNHKTYLLLALVLGIWGIIAFKIISAVNPPAEKTNVMATNDSFVPAKIKARDTFSIVANYRDPFLGTMPKSLKKSKSRKGIIKKNPIPDKNIIYTGFITESTSKKNIFFLTIDGQQQMMSKNDIIQDVKLISGNTDKVRIRYKGRTKTIYLTE
ncbi:hypothetical protein HZY62_15350 [Maribacter polysiphoniae]|uniref:Type II secretion system protein GspC N-terminal domain-containing protein n=1 Tax=Maribacter polysiphoniae TaxID=429344 RepID=A0A316DYR8_9FLAO|nr:hypothetical protein [Maribacter polysiphoniae]MBD1261978.1 hypothetical protein [Maribacter polysiphoniae]PWK21663.1 hypothetical protein LX92_03442 [Maribacter polysiphoniae]